MVAIVSRPDQISPCAVQGCVCGDDVDGYDDGCLQNVAYVKRTHNSGSMRTQADVAVEDVHSA